MRTGLPGSALWRASALLPRAAETCKRFENASSLKLETPLLRTICLRQTMRCCWRASLSALVLLRRASCFVVVAPAAVVSSQASCPCLYSTNTEHLRGTYHDNRGSSTFRRPWRSTRPTAGVGGRQAVSSGSSELDADTAAADVIVDPVQPDLNALRGMESILDFVGASTQWVVAGSVGAALVTRADAETLVWVIGSLFNAVFSKVLKKGINQVRPDGSRLQDPGMPSSHAMSLFYLGTYLIIGLQEHGMLSAGSAILPFWPLGVTETQALLAVYAVTASLWRVKAGFHTLPQVSVGAVVGALDAALWYNFCRGGLTSQVETFFGGPDIPTGVTVGVCLVTFFTFGNAQRRIAQALRRKEDTKKP